MKRTIYIVDDQPQVLETAVAIVEAVMPDAAVSAFGDPLQALDAIKAAPPDLILSDQLMPGMQGNHLLEQARLAAPEALRIIMSGYVSLDNVSVITTAHQYIAKPFEVQHLKRILERAFAARDRLQDPQLRAAVASLHSLPPLPQVHHALLLEMENGEDSTHAISQWIAQDADLSDKLLQLANSPLFGTEQLVGSPVEAVVFLGTKMIVAAVLFQALFRHYSANSHPEFSFQRVWNHCWQTAALAQCYCREHHLSHQDSEEAFLAGLMHETGRLILLDNFPEQFQAACDAARRDNTPLRPALRHQFHAAHCQIAAYLLDLWGLPAATVSAVSLMDHPEAQKPGAFSMASALYVADQVAGREFAPDSFPPDEWDAAYLRSIGCSGDPGQWTRPAARFA
jgi:HD-like signal output (HDOD) protein